MWQAGREGAQLSAGAESEEHMQEAGEKEERRKGRGLESRVRTDTSQ